MISKSPLPGFNMLLLGSTGTGKTYSIRTLIEQGITPFCVFTEPGFEVLGDIPCDKLHWHYIKPADQAWAAMIDSAKKINTFSFESLTKLSDINRKDYGLTWNAALETGGFLVGDEVRISVSIQAA